MKYFSLLVLSIFLFGCQQAQQDAGELETVVNTKEQGEMVEKGFMRNGMKNGPWTTFHTGKDAGRIHTIQHFIDGKLYGTALTFNNRGQLTNETNYEAGKKNGRSAKYQWGVTVEEMEYKDDLLDGVYKAYYRNNRKLQKLAHYKDGQLHGKYEYYNEDGKKVMDYEYVDGEKLEGGMVE
jgi:antitoxin component YwqK of YwqJK toxin-antitoxin module